MSNKSYFSEELTGLKISEPANYAAGLPAVKKAMDHLISEMGLVRAMQAINLMNKKSGFDCPGCAWPDPDDKRSVLGEYCENGAKALAEEATLKKVTADFFTRYSIQELLKLSDFELGKSGRITQPMIKKEGATHYQPIEWEAAFQIIASQLKSLQSPNEAIFYTSGRSSNEAAYLYGLLARRLGTNNLPDCSNMCHESSGVGLSETVGIGKGSTTLDDFEHAEVVLILGQNPGTNHPRMLSALSKTKKNGGKIITINPLEEAGLKRFKNPQIPSDILGVGTDITDVFMQVKINEDIALLQAIQKKLIEIDLTNSNTLDHDFIQTKTQGYESIKINLESLELTYLLEKAGIEVAIFNQAIGIIAPAKKIIICWAMGLTQHKNGVANIKECVNLLLMKGAIGKKGAGTCPVRGHSNVQGDRTVGINHKISKEFAQNIRNYYQFEPALEPGFDVVESIQAMYEKKAKIFFSLGGNFVAAASDTNYTAKALKNCDLTISISTKLNKTHLITGKIAIILPTLGRSEKDFQNGKAQKISVENSMGKVQPSQGILSPISDSLMSEPAIIGNLGKHLFGANDVIQWEKYITDYSLIRKDIEQVVRGFSNY